MAKEDPLPIGDLEKLKEGLQAMREGRMEDASTAWQEGRQIQEDHEKNKGGKKS